MAPERLGDAASGFAPVGAQPATAGPGDDGDGKAKDEDDALAVPGSVSPAPVAGTSGSDAWWNSVDMAGSAHGGVGSSTDNDVVPGFGEGDIPGFGNGGGGFGGRSGSGVDPWLMVLQWTAKGRMADSRLMVGPIYGMGTVGVVEVQGVGVTRSGMA